MEEVAVASVSYNTRELTALLLWSLHRILESPRPHILIVDNASTDGSTELLRRARDAGLCEVIENEINLGHGPALNQAMNAELVADARRVWILDSDCVITRSDALSAPLRMHPAAAVVGELHFDEWHGAMRHELYSLIVDPSALRASGAAAFTGGGDPAWELLSSAERLGLDMASFPFITDGHLVHRGRGSLAAVVAAGDAEHPLYAWAVDHHLPHFGGVDGAEQRYRRVLDRFRAEVGPDLDLVAALGV